MADSSHSHHGHDVQSPRQPNRHTRSQSSSCSFDSELESQDAQSASGSEENGFVLEPCGYISDDLDNEENPISCFRIPQLTVEEKRRLLFGIKRFGPGNLERISELLPERNLLQISNLITTLDSLCPKSDPCPLRFGYPSNEDDFSESSSESAHTISESDSSGAEFVVERQQVRYSRDLKNLVNWNLAIKRFSLPADKDLDLVSAHVIHSLVTYTRELMRVVSSISSAQPTTSGSHFVTTDTVEIALRSMPVIYKKESGRGISSPVRSENEESSDK